jgi:hypothetical protein
MHENQIDLEVFEKTASEKTATDPESLKRAEPLNWVETDPVSYEETETDPETSEKVEMGLSQVELLMQEKHFLQEMVSKETE